MNDARYNRLLRLFTDKIDEANRSFQKASEMFDRFSPEEKAEAAALLEQFSPQEKEVVALAAELWKAKGGR